MPKARVVPLQAEEVDHAAGYAFLVSDKLFILDIEDRAGRENVLVVIHQAAALIVCENNVLPDVGKLDGGRVWRHVNRHGVVNRIASTMNDLCLREGDVDLS